LEEAKSGAEWGARICESHSETAPIWGKVWQSAIVNDAKRLDWRHRLAAVRRRPARTDGAIAVALLVLPCVTALVLWLLWLRRLHLVVCRV